MSLSTTSSQYYVMLYIIQVIKGRLIKDNSVSTFKKEENRDFCKVSKALTFNERPKMKRDARLKDCFRFLVPKEYKLFLTDQIQ